MPEGDTSGISGIGVKSKYSSLLLSKELTLLGSRQ